MIILILIWLYIVIWAGSHAYVIYIKNPMILVLPIWVNTYFIWTAELSECQKFIDHTFTITTNYE